MKSSSVIFVEGMSIKLEVNFGPKPNYDYHSNEFYTSFYVSNKPDQPF